MNFIKATVLDMTHVTQANAIFIQRRNYLSKYFENQGNVVFFRRAGLCRSGVTTDAPPKKARIGQT